MRISIITVTYNSAAVLAACLDSVLTQSHTDIEQVVIDGASTDNTLEILRLSRSRIATVVSEPDKGIYDALNKGISSATGDIIGVLHADDVFSDSSVLARINEEFISRFSLVYANRDPRGLRCCYTFAIASPGP